MPSFSMENSSVRSISHNNAHPKFLHNSSVVLSEIKSNISEYVIHLLEGRLEETLSNDVASVTVAIFSIYVDLKNEKE